MTDETKASTCCASAILRLLDRVPNKASSQHSAQLVAVQLSSAVAQPAHHGRNGCVIYTEYEAFSGNNWSASGVVPHGTPKHWMFIIASHGTDIEMKGERAAMLLRLMPVRSEEKMMAKEVRFRERSEAKACGSM